MADILIFMSLLFVFMSAWWATSVFHLNQYENGKVDDIAIVSTLGAVATIVISFITISFVIF